MDGERGAAAAYLALLLPRALRLKLALPLPFLLLPEGQHAAFPLFGWQGDLHQNHLTTSFHAYALCDYVGAAD